MVKQYGNEVLKRKINFTPALVNELLHYVEEAISTETAKQDFDTQFTKQYKHEVNIRISIGKFETEEAVASTLCAYLEEHIKNKVKSMLGSVIASKMSTEVHFSNKKKALKITKMHIQTGTSLPMKQPKAHYIGNGLFASMRLSFFNIIA